MRVANSTATLRSVPMLRSQVSSMAALRHFYRPGDGEFARQGSGEIDSMFASFAEVAAACHRLPPAHADAAEKVASREATLTKPPGSLGRLEDLTRWLALWQGRSPPRLARVDILVFAGNHGVTAQGVSAYPA